MDTASEDEAGNSQLTEHPLLLRNRADFLEAPHWQREQGRLCRHRTWGRKWPRPLLYSFYTNQTQEQVRQQIRTRKSPCRMHALNSLGIATKGLSVPTCSINTPFPVGEQGKGVTEVPMQSTTKSQASPGTLQQQQQQQTPCFTPTHNSAARENSMSQIPLRRTAVQLPVIASLRVSLG